MGGYVELRRQEGWQWSEEEEGREGRGGGNEKSGVVVV